MEELIRVKDEEIEKLNHMKEMLKAKLKDLKDTNNSLESTVAALKEQNEQLEHQIQEPDKSISKDDIEKLKTENQQHQKLISELKSKLSEKDEEIVSLQKSKKQTEDELESLKERRKNLADSSNDMNVLKPSQETGEEELSPAKLMRQLKNGMFKLGQQNFSIEKKIDKLLSKIGSEDNYSSSSTTSTSGYSSPGFSQASQVNQPPSKSIHRESARARKPSDILKQQSADTSSQPKSQEATSEEPKQTSIPASTPSKTRSMPSKKGGLITVERPQGGSGAITCPHCGEQNFAEQEDRSRILSYAPIKKYGKKYYCKSCRGEWRYN